MYNPNDFVDDILRSTDKEEEILKLQGDLADMSHLLELHEQQQVQTQIALVAQRKGRFSQSKASMEKMEELGRQLTDAKVDLEERQSNGSASGTAK